MVYASAFCAVADEKRLRELGANDSKQLSEDQRDQVRKKIEKASFVGTDQIVLHADELSAKMLRPQKYNLNSISHDTAFSLVRRALDRGVNVKEVYVDTVGSPDVYARKFRDMFPDLEKVVVEKKADGKYAVVSTASIIAKTTRDRVVRDWVFMEEDGQGDVGTDEDTRCKFAKSYGSGYPSDPRTKAWLRCHVDRIFGYPSFVRFSWSTARAILDREAVQVTW